MKGILFLIILVVIGFFAYTHFAQPPDPAAQLEKAQTSGTKAIDYWVKMLLVDNTQYMTAICDDTAKTSSESIREEIRAIEQQNGGTFDDSPFIRSMGGGGAVKVILSGDDVGKFSMTVIVNETDGKWWITSISQP